MDCRRPGAAGEGEVMKRFLGETDSDGLLTDMACAADAIIGAGCDCGTDEPGACLGCVCTLALLTERKRSEQAEAERDKVKAEMDTTLGALAAAVKRIAKMEQIIRMR